MALIKCPECGKSVSDAAPACPGCGYPISTHVPQKPVEPDAARRATPAGPGEQLMEVGPSWWNYFWYLLFCWLIVPWIIAWWKHASEVLHVYPGRLLITRGIFSKEYREYMARDIRAIDIDQTFLQRVLGIGDLTISTSATVDANETLRGIPNPHALRDLILAQRGSH